MPTGNLARKCVWVMADGTYCGAPVSWHMVEDGNEPGAPLVREYYSFCTEHEAKRLLQSAGIE